MFRIFTSLLLATLALGCADTTPDEARATAVAADSVVMPEAPRSLVTLAGTVVVFGRSEVTLAGVTVCEDGTGSCATSDDAGAFELFVPAESSLLLVAERGDLFTSLVPVLTGRGESLKVEVFPRTAGEAFVKLAEGELQDDTGMIFVNVRDSAGAGVLGAWLTIRDFAAWGPIFTEPGIVPAQREATGGSGFGAYLELPEGPEDVGVSRKGSHCHSPHLKQTSDGLYRLPVRSNTISWLNVVCD